MNNQVKEIVFTGPDGKLVGKYKKGQSLNPPIALLIHPHPLYGGTMNNPIVIGPRICAPEPIITLSSKVGCLFLSF